MRLPRRSLWSVVAALVGAASSLPAQGAPPTPFDPFPGGSAARYHFDLARNFFSSPADELARREQLRPRLERLGARVLKSHVNPPLRCDHNGASAP